MGIKDWFGGGNKKQDEFREKVKEAVSDGKLTAQKMAELEAQRKELDAEDASDDKTRYRREAYNEAVGAVKAGGKLTPAEAKELAKIQKFLALSDDQIEKTRWDLVRLKTFTEIREGRLPVVSPTHNALRQIRLPEGETPHYCVPAELFLLSDPAAKPGARFTPGTPFALGAGSSFELPMSSAEKVDSGVFLFTSQHMLILADGHKQIFPLKIIENLQFYNTGIRLKSPKGHYLIRFQSDAVVDVVGALAEQLIS